VTVEALFLGATAQVRQLLQHRHPSRLDTEGCLTPLSDAAGLVWSVHVAGAIPQRIRWAVEALAVDEADRVFEIGGGPGVAASLAHARPRYGSPKL
jgi:hypothetical protein